MKILNLNSTENNLPLKLSAIIKVTENCNFNCAFCFYAQSVDQRRKIMDVNLCKKIMLDTVKYNVKNGIFSVNFIFHGGEPLLVGLRYFNEIMLYEKELKEKYNLEKIENCIQTNASLVNDRWIEFFKENKFSVGISIDGDKDLNNHIEKHCEKCTKKSIASTIEKYHKMLDSGVDVGILSVITKKHLENPQKFYNFIVDNDIKSIGILPCVNDESNDTLPARDYGKFLKELFDLYFYGDHDVSIREFDIAMEKAMGSTIVRNCANCNRKYL